MNEDPKDAFEFNTKELDKLMNLFKHEMPTFQLGILGSSPRIEGEKTNAEIGAKHEFGLEGMPVRSWLRMPLVEQFQAALQKAQPFTPQSIKEIIQLNSLVPWVKRLAIVAESVIQEGFATGGFGKWQKHAPGYTNNTGQILVDTAQLRNSVTSEVKE